MLPLLMSISYTRKKTFNQATHTVRHFLHTNRPVIHDIWWDAVETHWVVRWANFEIGGTLIFQILTISESDGVAAAALAALEQLYSMDRR